MQITLNAATIYECEGVRLMPGINEVDDANALKKFKANKMVAADIKSGLITMGKAKAEKEDKKAEFVPDPSKSDAENAKAKEAFDANTNSGGNT